MDYRKPSKKVIVETVLEVLKERGSVDTQTKMHKHTLKRLKSKDENYRLSAERMRVVAIQSKKVKIGIRTRSVGAVPEADESDFRKQGLGYDRSEEHTSELQSRTNLVCRLLLEKKKTKKKNCPSKLNNICYLWT